jgi:hypothetical protein
MSVDDELRRIIREELANMAQPREWLTPQNVAVELDLSESTVYAKNKRAIIPSHSFDGRLYVSRTELDAALRAAPLASEK